MAWNFILVVGSARGILVGLRSLCFELISWEASRYCVVAIIKNCDDKFTWRLIVMYGSPYDSNKLEFLEELDFILSKWQGPIPIGGTLT
jgi:hypothetical protein